MMAMNFKIRIPPFLKSVKHLLFVVNGVFLLTGLLLFLIGVIIVVKFNEYDELITKRFFSVSNLAIATGVIIFLISALGVYAAISQEFYFILGYVVLLLVVLVFNIVILTLGYSLSNNTESEIKTTMIQSLHLYGSRIEVTKMWDDLQMGFECCGVVGRFDWISNQIPVSCCHIDYGTISPFICDSGNAYNMGCAGILGEYLSNLARIIGITGIVVTTIQTILTTLAITLAWRSKFEDVELES